MESLRHWIMLLCGGCILYGLLENLLPRRGVYPVIKVVLTLYILLLLISPAGSVADFEMTLPDFPPSISLEEKTPDTEEFLQQASISLRHTLSDALTGAGFDVQILEVELENSGRVITAVRLRLQAAPQQDTAAIQAKCDSLLGVPAAYTWENE